MRMKNPFLSIAFRKAAGLAGSHGRVLSLLVQLTRKLRGHRWDKAQWQSAKNDFMLIGRMLHAHTSGSFKIRSTRIVITLLAALIYFVNPLDLIPDYILGAGLADDFAVLTWVIGTAQEEVNRFKLQIQPVA